MKRGLLNLVAALSVVPCAAASVLWSRGRSLPHDYWASAGSNWVVGLAFDHDAFYFYQVTGWPYRFSAGVTHTSGASPLDSTVLSLPRGARAWERFGLRYVSAGGGTRSVRQRLLVVPAWQASAALGAVPHALGARRLARFIRRRPGPGHCPSCGYDLTGNVSGVCPECGAAAGIDTARPN
jgi:hypothetical protein